MFVISNFFLQIIFACARGKTSYSLYAKVSYVMRQTLVAPVANMYGRIFAQSWKLSARTHGTFAQVATFTTRKDGDFMKTAAAKIRSRLKAAELNEHQRTGIRSHFKGEKSRDVGRHARRWQDSSPFMWVKRFTQPLEARIVC